MKIIKGLDRNKFIQNGYVTLFMGFPDIPITGNEYSFWLGFGGRGKRLVGRRVRFPGKGQRAKDYMTHTEYLNKWRILCQIAHEKAIRVFAQAGDKILFKKLPGYKFSGAVRITPILFCNDHRRYLDNGNTIQGLKPIVDIFTNPRGSKKHGLGLIDDDRHDQAFFGDPFWKPNLSREDRLILIFQDYVPIDPVESHEELNYICNLLEI